MTGTRLTPIITIILSLFVMLYGGLSCLLPVCGATAQGEITEIAVQESAKQEKAQVRFSFTDEKGKTHHGGYTLENADLPQAGAQIAVQYLPFAPLVCNVEGSGMISPRISVLLLVLCCVLLLFSILSLVRWQKRRRA